MTTTRESSFLRLHRQLWMGLLLLAGVASAQSAPPWALESPGAAGSLFGLGLDAIFEQQDSLEVTEQLTTILTRTPNGGEETGEFRGDPERINSVTDFEWKSEGPGAQIPIALPAFHLGGLRIHPSLVLQAASTDVTFESRDRQTSSSFEGRGTSFGGALELSAALCRSCPWFASGGLRFQSLPDLDAGPSSLLRGPGAEVLADEAQLSRSVGELSARFGYSPPGRRAAVYLGIRGYKSDVEIEEEVRFTDALGGQTRTVHTELEGERVSGVVGLDVRLAGTLYGRAEAALSCDDRRALVKVVYMVPRGRGTGSPSGSSSGEGTGGTGATSGTPSGESTSGTEGGDEEGLVQVGPKAPDEEAELDRRASQIAAAIAPLLAAIEADFLAGWKGLLVVDGPHGPSYRADDVEALLNETERRLVSVLGEYPELEALKDGVQDEIRNARKELGLDAGASRSEGTPDRDTLAFAAFSPQRHRGFQLVQKRLLPKQRTDQVLSRVAEKPVGTPKRAAQADRLRRTITFRTNLPRGTTLLIYPRYNRTSPHASRLAANAPQKVWLGTASFEVWPRGQRGRPYCDANASGPDAMCPLDLLYNVCSVVRCDQFACTLQGCRP